MSYFRSTGQLHQNSKTLSQPLTGIARMEYNLTYAFQLAQLIILNSLTAHFDSFNSRLHKL